MMMPQSNGKRPSGKELIYGALRHENLPCIPWVPFAGVHAGRLIGYPAIEVMKDGKKLLESLLRANQLYEPDGQPVIFDLQVEAEILGCEMMWLENGPPMVASHPLESSLKIPAALPEPQQGRLPLILEVMRAMKKNVGDQTALYGLVCGPLTLASHLRGSEVFMDMFKNLDFLNALLPYCQDVTLRMADLYREAGMDVIAVVDPLVSQISPRHFSQLLAVPFKNIYAGIRQMGVFSSFFVCGNATKNIENMCLTNPDSIHIDDNINLPAAKKVTDAHNIAIGGNIPPTTQLLHGAPRDTIRYVIDLLDQLGDPANALQPNNFILAPGCDLPYDVPPENVLAAVRAIHDPQKARQELAG
jgi:uroporphyrinogen decarboxylase